MKALHCKALKHLDLGKHQRQTEPMVSEILKILWVMSARCVTLSKAWVAFKVFFP